MLPQAFLERMQTLLGSEFPAFQAALLEPRVNSVRVNTLKSNMDVLERLVGQVLERVPWSEAGAYTSHEWRLGSSWLHAVGGLYIQEASAMAVAEALGPQPGERVLDLCAAPGGKSTHLAALMHNQGLLVSNEIVGARARILLENLERLGAHGVVTNESPGRLAHAWPGFFDRVLVDAPCSGEGMFRKNLDAVREWSVGAVLECARRQQGILEDAAVLLKPGGTLVYSTCTFAPEENEQVIESFLNAHLEFVPEHIHAQGLEPDSHMLRLWPHRVRGEGHFVARLRKVDGDEPRVRLVPHGAIPSKLRKSWLEFAQSVGADAFETSVFRGEVQAIHAETPSLEGLKTLRIGPALAEIKGDRFEPAHALSHLAVNPENTLDLEPDDPRAASFMRGEPIEDQGEPGWVLVRVAGLGLGWGKRVGQTVKNHYPKSLRVTASSVRSNPEDLA